MYMYSNGHVVRIQREWDSDEREKQGIIKIKLTKKKRRKFELCACVYVSHGTKTIFQRCYKHCTLSHCVRLPYSFVSMNRDVYSPSSRVRCHYYCCANVHGNSHFTHILNAATYLIASSFCHCFYPCIFIPFSLHAIVNAI